MIRLKSTTAWLRSELADMTEQRNKAAEHTADLARALRLAEEQRDQALRIAESLRQRVEMLEKMVYPSVTVYVPGDHSEVGR